MVLGFAEKYKRMPTWTMIEHCVQRNFGGLDHAADKEPVNVFMRELYTVLDTQERTEDDPDCTPVGLIHACLHGDDLNR